MINREKIISQIDLLFPSLQESFKDPKLFQKQNYTLKKFVVLYDKLFSYAVFQNDENFFQHSFEYNSPVIHKLYEIWAWNEKIECRFSSLSVYRQNDSNRFLTKLELILESNEENDTVLENEINCVLNEFQMLVNKTLALFSFRQNLLANFFLFDSFPSSKFYFLIFLLNLDSELFLVSSDLKRFWQNSYGLKHMLTKSKIHKKIGLFENSMSKALIILKDKKSKNEFIRFLLTNKNEIEKLLKVDSSTALTKILEQFESLKN